MEILSHTLPGVEVCTVEAIDAPGDGGANHRYRLAGFNLGTNRSATDLPEVVGQDIFFQNGPVPQYGVNGVTVEALLAVCIHRLQGFQAGPYPSRENALALTNLEQAMHWLHHRTLDRLRRSVEGVLTP